MSEHDDDVVLTPKQRERRLERAQATAAETETDLGFMMKYFVDNDITKISLNSLKIRLSCTEPALRNMAQAVRTIIACSDDDDQKAKVQEMFAEFKTDYFDLISSIQDEMDERLTRTSSATPPEGGRPERELMAKCPRLTIPEFDGATENWTKFRDLFTSLVHDAGYSNIVKFQYLMSALKMPAQQNVLTSYTLCADNYEPAWKAVCARYNDKRKILHHHLTQLFAIKKMSSPSSGELRKLIDAVTTGLNSIEPLGFVLSASVDTANVIVVHLVTQRLHDDILKEWKKDCTADFSAWAELRDFLITMWRTLDDIQPVVPSTSRSADHKATRPAKTFVSNQTKSNRPACAHCSADHLLWKCSSFAQLPVQQRYSLVKEKSLCLNCFHSGHQHSECPSKHRCKTCQKAHHTLLHFDSSRSLPNHATAQQSSSSMCPDTKPFTPYNMIRTPSAPDAERNTFFASTTLAARHSFKASRQTLLFTVSILVADEKGTHHLGRALVDTGSDLNFMTTKFANQLRLPVQTACIPVTGINEKTVIVRQTAEATASSRYGQFNITMGFALLPSITGNLPHRSIPLADVQIPDEYFLADPLFYEASDCDMLLNIDVFFDILLGEKIRLASGPKLVHTTFGWMVGGALGNDIQTPRCAMYSFCGKASTVSPDLDEKLSIFFKLDDCDDSKPTLTAEERYCEDLFVTTTTTGVDGKFTVSMPFKSNITTLGNNFANAERALKWQEARRRKNPVYDQLYVDYMLDYIETGHMTEVSPDSTDAVHYLPHHGVLKMTSTSTKLRPVFNASSKSHTGVSLNDTLCVGPTVQPDSLDILLRFREKKFVLSGDITKMYRQVWVQQSQRDFLRILWRSSFDEPVKHYQLNTVTFGTACAPFLATRCIKQLAIDNEKAFPAAAAVLSECFYVDDALFGVNSIDEGLKIRDQLRLILSKAGMSLCKFSSNNPALLADLPAALIEPSNPDAMNISKRLGIRFNSATDQFSYNFDVAINEKREISTKSSVLSEIASIYDPVGWLGPVVLTAKLIMKKLWLSNIGWKDSLPSTLQEEWDEFRKKLPCLNSVLIARRCVIDQHIKVNIHGFCDASIEAYGAVVYVRSTNANGDTSIAMLGSKSRVAPKSQKTLARLELCSALLLAKLTERISSALSVTVDSVTLWSDATIVLNWMSFNPSRLTTFVGNRVAAIQDLTHRHQWRHIRGVDNPADIISRGLPADELQSCVKWWTGPDFLLQPQDTWPESIVVLNEDDPDIQGEVKRTMIVRPPNDVFTFIETRYSNTRKLISVVTYIRRFLKRQLNSTVMAERELAESTIVKTLQKHFYRDEYDRLQQFAEHSTTSEFRLPQVSRQSSLISLAPFMDSAGLIRVGGRIDASPGLTNLQKHPILLPSSNFALNLVRELHQQHMHLGQLGLLALIREKYYLVRARSLVRQAVHSCLKCYRLKPTETTQFMSDLPPARVTLTPPFVNVAVDYTGFYHIRANLTRNTTSIKSYVVMFKCMCTGAIHLDLVTKLTTEAFIAVLDRFVSRRGMCNTIFCDNATYFVGADAELQKIVHEMQPDVQSHLTTAGINFKFTTPRAAHAGGIYESGIKSAKHHLKRVIDDTLYTYEEFTTILCKIEALLNSRPLTPLSDDPHDLQPLTPGHFLIGRPLIAKPERDVTATLTNRLTRWESIQKVQHEFWKRWYREYLTTLQSRPVNFREIKTIPLGALVLIKDKNVPPMKWLLGRIIELLPGKHNIVRNVKLHTSSGEKTRHVKDLYFLPIDDNSEPGEGVPVGTE